MPTSPPNPNSLLTGKLTGKFADSSASQRFWRPVGERIQRLAVKFPTQRNREFFSKNREFSRQNRELDLPLDFYPGALDHLGPFGDLGLYEWLDVLGHHVGRL